MASQWIWQAPTWPALAYSLEHLIDPLSRARTAAGRLRGKAEGLGYDELTGLERDIWSGSAVATAEIEGEKLSFEAVRSSVSGRLGLAPLGHLSVPKNVEALLDVMNAAASQWHEPLSAELLIDWQALICEGSRLGRFAVETGRFRSDSVEIVSGPEGRKTVHYEGPPAHFVPRDMTRFLDWFNGTQVSAEIDGLLRAGLSHIWFESIHPFADGNGRVGRAILDRAIGQDAKSASRLHGLSIEILSKKSVYYQQLNQASRGSGDVTDWLAWFLDNFADSCNASSLLIDDALVRTRFWSDHKETNLNERQRKALTRMLAAGPGKFEGGMTVRKYVALTKANTRLTANRDLTDMVEKQLLVREGAGRSTFYNLNIRGWGWRGAPPGESMPR